MTPKILRALVYVGAILTALVLAGIVGYILINGIPHLKPSLFEWTYTSENVSLMPALIDTILMDWQPFSGHFFQRLRPAFLNSTGLM